MNELGSKEDGTGNAAALIGIALDVSGSMQSSLRNRSGLTRSRFDSLRLALAQALEQKTTRGGKLSTPEDADLLVFIYAFGMSSEPDFVDLLSLLKAADGAITPGEIESLKQRYIKETKQRYSGYSGLGSLARSYGFGNVVSQIEAEARSSAEAQICQKIKDEVMRRVASRLSSLGGTTLSISELARFWSTNDSSFQDAEQFIFGATPMRRCLEAIAARFERETKSQPSDLKKLLIVVSDGDPTDGSPLPAADRIKDLGVTITCCYITDSDVVKARLLPGQTQAAWPAAAKLMFNMASPLGPLEAYSELLQTRGWHVEDGARLFTQVNHSELLEEFMQLTVDKVSYA